MNNAESALDVEVNMHLLEIVIIKMVSQQFMGRKVNSESNWSVRFVATDLAQQFMCRNFTKVHK